MTPFLSIIIPIYKIKESYLRECFDSLLAQDMKDFQIIAVDDGSPDQSGDICDEYAQKDERVIVIHQENAGVSVARNAGIKAASTEWITFVDPDDWVESNHVSTLYNAQKKYNDFDIFWFDYVQEFDGKSNVKYLKDSSGVLDKEWVHNLKIAPFNFLSVNGRAYEYETNTIWNKMYRASLLKDNEIWFDPKARKGQDVIFNAECLQLTDKFYYIHPPVGVKFEADNIYTLDSNGRMILTILASVAEEESHSKSIIMNWSIDRRFSRGLFLTPALLGYDKDEEGNLVINPEEAQTVKVIYYLYLNGYSLTEIATLLMEYSRKTKLGRVEWNPGTLAGVLANERHCGDVLARKTFTPNFLTHKSKKNNNDRTQYRQKNHHEAIVSREVFNAANHLRASRNYSKKNRPLPVLSVVEDGILRGYVPFDKDWTGFSAEEYREASESVMKEPDATVAADVKKRLDLTGYEVVRAQYFSTMQNPAMTISNGRLRFNTACLKKFENVEYVELLLNSVERCIAIRPCDKNNPNAIRWGRLKEGRWCASTLGCRGLAKTLFDIMEWDEDLRYRFRGQFLEQGDNKMMLFAFDEPEMIKVEEIVLPPKENTEEDEGETVKKKIYIFPPEWAGTFGQPITSIAQVGILRQEHYAGNWDVFRPATEIEEMNIFTAESLNELLREAEKIMEGWTDYR